MSIVHHLTLCNISPVSLTTNHTPKTFSHIFNSNQQQNFIFSMVK